jgi:hypothetical protein
MNTYLAFRQLLPSSPLQVGVVQSVTGNGSVIVELPDGGRVTVRGDGVSALQHVYIRDGQVQGVAPNITPVEYSA